MTNFREPPAGEGPSQYPLIDVVSNAAGSKAGPEQKSTAGSEDTPGLLLVHGTLPWSEVVEATAIKQETHRRSPERQVSNVASEGSGR